MDANLVFLSVGFRPEKRDAQIRFYESSLGILLSREKEDTWKYEKKIKEIRMKKLLR